LALIIWLLLPLLAQQKTEPSGSLSFSTVIISAGSSAAQQFLKLGEAVLSPAHDETDVPY